MFNSCRQTIRIRGRMKATTALLMIMIMIMIMIIISNLFTNSVGLIEARFYLGDKNEHL